MKIALIGYGNMGQEIERVVQQGGKHTVVSVTHKTGREPLDIEGIKRADVVIDFTSPEVVIDTIQAVAKLGKNLVIGTSGWYGNIKDVKRLVKKNNSGLIYAQNFSVGVNVFFQTLSYAAKMFNKFPQYDVFGYEVHHGGKKDSPSSTAKKVADIVLGQIARKKTPQFDRVNRKIESGELHFASIRGGKNFGMHEIVFDSDADEITLRVQARTRRGYGEGAIMAAEFIKGKKGFFAFEDLFAKEVKK